MLKHEKSRCVQLSYCNISYNYIIYVPLASFKNSFSGVSKMLYCIFVSIRPFAQRNGYVA